MESDVAASSTSGRIGFEFLLINPNGPESRSFLSRGHNDSNVAPIIRLLGQPSAEAARR